MTIHVPADAAALAASLQALAHLDSPSVGFAPALQQAVTAAQEVFAVTGAGVMLLDDGQILRYVAASGPSAGVLELLQEQMNEGPCIDAFEQVQTVAVSDVEHDSRYPDFGPAAVRAGIQAVLGVPIQLDAGVVGTLNVFADTPREWDDRECDAIASYGLLVATLLRNAAEAESQGTLNAQLDRALQHRILVEQAKGIVMGREGLDAATAFEVLRSQARSTRTSIHTIALGVINGTLRRAAPDASRRP